MIDIEFLGAGLIGLLLAASGAWGQTSTPDARVRLIVMADMGNEPDEEQQMAHMLICSNTFDVEGLISVTGKYLRPEDANPYRQVTHPELFIKLINAYAQAVARCPGWAW